MNTQPLGSILLNNPQIKRLLQRARLLQNIQDRLQPLLPAAVTAHCRIAALDGGVLTLHADSPTWAARLRFSSVEILKACQKDTVLQNIRTLRIRVQPRAMPRQRTGGFRARLSGETARRLRAAADSVHDPELRAALLRLARHGG